MLEGKLRPRSEVETFGIFRARVFGGSLDGTKMKESPARSLYARITVSRDSVTKKDRFISETN
jgi:hypothetical protein